jgi:hypothetical protein
MVHILFKFTDGNVSHTNSELPGQIHEGGELGYALAVAFGAALDSPDLIVTCIVGGMLPYLRVPSRQSVYTDSVDSHRW